NMPWVMKPAETKKWACAHWCVSPILVLHNSFQIQIYAARNEKTNDQPHPVSSSCLCKEVEGAGFPFQIESLEDGVDDAIRAAKTALAEAQRCWAKAQNNQPLRTSRKSASVLGRRCGPSWSARSRNCRRL